MPDPLLGAGGKKVTTPEQWQKRREEMKRVIERYETGHAPPPPGNVKGRDVQTVMLMDGKVTFRLVHLTFGPGEKLGFDAALFIPNVTEAGKTQFPTIVHPSFYPTPGTTPPTNPPATNEMQRTAIRLAAPEEAVKLYEQPLKRGYALMVFNYQQGGADSRNFRDTGFFPAYPGYDWGDLAAWAWTMSRCVDYLETQPFADKSRLIALGHSRLGKTALVAGAFDERFALTAPAGSGCGGTGAFRFNGKGRGGKEGLDDVIRKFPQWFGPGLLEFSGQVEKLPFDQHWSIALVAPRRFIAADGLDDPAANGNALAQAYLAAKPVYAMLGVPDHLGINYRPGKHMLAPDDWTAILDFSDQQLRKLDVKRRFDELPPAEQLH